jgi:hypothetical protein
VGRGGPEPDVGEDRLDDRGFSAGMTFRATSPVTSLVSLKNRAVLYPLTVVYGALRVCRSRKRRDGSLFATGHLWAINDRPVVFGGDGSLCYPRPPNGVNGGPCKFGDLQMGVTADLRLFAAHGCDSVPAVIVSPLWLSILRGDYVRGSGLIGAAWFFRSDVRAPVAERFGTGFGTLG